MKVQSSDFSVQKRNGRRQAASDAGSAAYCPPPSSLARPSLRSPKRRAAAFTLIELLVVIAIIGILVGLLFPAIKGAISKAKSGKARTEMKSIEGAVRSYYTEYGKVPVKDSLQGVGPEQSNRFGLEINNSELLNVLRSTNAAPNVNGVLNPRQIVFLEANTTTSNTKPGIGPDGNFRDPWGVQYIIVIDMNYDNNANCGTPYPGTQSRPVAVISLGPDKAWSTSSTTDPKNTDNILSWN